MSIENCIRQLQSYVEKNPTQTLHNYHASLDVYDREYSYKPFTSAFLARVVYMILGLAIPTKIAKCKHNPDLVEKMKSEWEQVLGHKYCMNLLNIKEALEEEREVYGADFSIEVFANDTENAIHREAIEIPADYCPKCGEEVIYDCCCYESDD
mmetsp:Transcript_20527/g.33134  ORF Transcript_20527/g.33134 Transcript_20527/m.33134 type:complete len:153 (+) Transcript_20527:415-873(+)